MQDAQAYIEDSLNSGNGRGNRNQRGDQENRSFPQQNQNDRQSYRSQDVQPSEFRSIQIDQSQVGAIIGRGGAKIRELEDKHQVSLKIGK